MASKRNGWRLERTWVEQVFCKPKSFEQVVSQLQVIYWWLVVYILNGRDGKAYTVGDLVHSHQSIIVYPLLATHGPYIVYARRYIMR